MNAKEVVFVNNFSVAGSLNSIKDYWDKLTAIAQNTVTSLKSCVIVKEKIDGSAKLIC